MTYLSPVASLDEYLARVRLTRDEWDVPDHKELWFRAEDEKHLKTHLKPGLYRPRKDAKRKSVKALLELENDLYEEFRRCATQLTDLTLEDEEWDSYFLMQHHGVPTRLLDWSDGALIALHFAVSGKSAPFESGSVVHVLDPWWLGDLLRKHPDRMDAQKRWKKYSRKYPYEFDEDEWERLYLPEDEEDAKHDLLTTPVTPLLWDSPHVSRRVAAQRSRFMIFGTDPDWLSKRTNNPKCRLFSFSIPTNAISGIKQDLRDAGITESVVFPDLDGLGRELRQLWEGRR
jgi:hypothetical protein